MKKTYVTIIVLVIVIGGVILISATGKKAEAPTSQTQSNVSVPINNNQADNSKDTNAGTVNVSVPPVTVNKTVAPIKEFTITGKNFSFTPSLITVKKGDTVKINFKNENGFHNLTIDEFNVATQNIQGGAQDSIEFVANKTGSFQYYCSVGTHRAMGMWGTLKVE